eukprot:9439801-Alexandrium_andersonii.AAC.1
MQGVTTPHVKSGGVSGGPNLKKTQIYPKGFAEAVYEAFRKAELHGNFFEGIDLSSCGTTAAGLVGRCGDEGHRRLDEPPI